MNTQYQSLWVNGTINDIQCAFIIDSGAGVTVLGSTFFNTYLINNFKLIPSTIHVSAANKQPMTVNGMVIINIQIGTLMDNVKFLVVNEIGMDIIIGNDQLKQWNTVINYEHETIEFNHNTKVSINICRNSEEGKVKLEESTVLQPNSICQVTVQLDSKVKGSIRLIHTLPQLQYKGMVHVKEGIVGTEPKAHVWIVNRAPYKITVTKGTTIAQIVTDPTLEDQLNDIKILRTMVTEAVKPSHKVQQEKETERQDNRSIHTKLQIEQQIRDMDLAVDTDLNKEQQEQLRQLLLKHIKIFADNPQSPSITHGVQHLINTGDQQPIKQHPRRVSPAMEELI